MSQISSNNRKNNYGEKSGVKPLILLGSSDIDNLRDTARLLRNLGYNVITTPNSRRIVNLAIREKPALIIIDYNLTDQNGIETCRMICEKTGSDIPIIFCSSTIEEDLIIKAYQAGAVDYFQKPCSSQLFQTKVKIHIQKSAGNNLSNSLSFDEQIIEKSLLPTYKLIEKLGSGSMGSVYKAKNKLTSDIVAIKVIKTMFVRNNRAIQRFFRGSLIGLELAFHPNLVEIYEIKRTSDFIFQVMEYVSGKTLLYYILNKQLLTEEQAIKILRCVGSALNHLHNNQVIHRDVKPGNLFILDNWEAKLGDMGISRHLVDRNATSSGHIVGTPGYLAPEQILDIKPIDVRADLFSLGLTLYHALTGVNPYIRKTTYASMVARIEGPECHLDADQVPGFSDQFRRILNKLLRKKPKHRYQVPAELLSDLKILKT